jgi:23S rRNA pseudouridine1911/1915/1917 synthase
MVEFGHHPREAGLVHRLDTATSGLLLAATDGASFDELSKALRSGHLHKRYLALAVGTLHDQGYVLSRIAAGRGGRVLTTDLSHEPGVRTAESTVDLRSCDYRVLERRGQVALVELSVSAAYRHQIRAQLAAIGSPILGDAKYGSAVRWSRHALHASWLSYGGGPVVAAFQQESPLPTDLATLWQQCLTAPLT